MTVLKTQRKPNGHAGGHDRASGGGHKANGQSLRHSDGLYGSRMCRPHAFLWIDTVGGVVIGGLEHDLSGAETYNFSHRESLLIYSKQFRSGDLDFHGRKLPAAFRRDFNDWIAYARVEHNRWMANVSRRYLVGSEEPSPYIQFRFVDARGQVTVLPPDPEFLFDDGKATPAP